MRRAHAAALLIVALILPGFPASAEPTVTETVKTYLVSGNTPREIRADINRERKKDDAAGADFDGVTRWNARWNFEMTLAEQGCSIASVSVTVDIVITMPELAPGAPRDVRQRFDQYLAHLLVHERGHAEVAVDAGRKIEAALAAMPPSPTCPELGAAANEIASTLITRARERNKEYDTETRHGLLQGARFP